MPIVLSSLSHNDQNAMYGEIFVKPPNRTHVALDDHCRGTMMKKVAIAALTALVSTSALAQDRCKSLMESGQVAITSVETIQGRYISLRAQADGSRTRGEMLHVAADLERAYRTVGQVIREALSAKCESAEGFVEAEIATEEMVVAIRAEQTLMAAAAEPMTTGSINGH
jgi:hypothetical protein